MKNLGQGATQHEAWRDALRQAGNLGTVSDPNHSD